MKQKRDEYSGHLTVVAETAKFCHHKVGTQLLFAGKSWILLLIQEAAIDIELSKLNSLVYGLQLMLPELGT